MADPLDRFVADGASFSQPLLDRLLDADPDRQDDPPLRPVDQVRLLREAIRRDLEALLNTRRPPVTPPRQHVQLESALVSFGVESFVAVNLGTDSAKARFARSVERRIALFETRLANVKVTVLKNRTERERALRMRIQATFRLDETMPPVRFESTVDPTSHRIEIDAFHG